MFRGKAGKLSNRAAAEKILREYVKGCDGDGSRAAAGDEPQQEIQDSLCGCAMLDGVGNVIFFQCP